MCQLSVHCFIILETRVFNFRHGVVFCKSRVYERSAEKEEKDKRGNANVTFMLQKLCQNKCTQVSEMGQRLSLLTLT